MFPSGLSASFAWLWLAGAAALIEVVVVLILIARGRSARDESGTIFAGRLARGEIDADEYARMRAALGASSHPVGTTRPGVVLAVVSLIAILAFGGLTLAGAWPRPGSVSVDLAADVAADTGHLPRSRTSG